MGENTSPNPLKLITMKTPIHNPLTLGRVEYLVIEKNTINLEKVEKMWIKLG
jgi:hypothetical protein